MKNSKTNVINLLKELQEEALILANAFRLKGMNDGNEHHKGKYLAYGTVINLFADEDYFNHVKDAFNNKG